MCKALRLPCVLCQDEGTCRETVAIQRRLQRVKFEQQATLEEFNFTETSSKLPPLRPGILDAYASSIATSQRFSGSGWSRQDLNRPGSPPPRRTPVRVHVRCAKNSWVLSDLADGHADALGRYVSVNSSG